MTNRTYPAKIILFGVYSLLLGSQVLGLPMHSRNGYWTHKEEYNSTFKQGFLPFLETECAHLFNINRINDIRQHKLYYGSSIKRGYGTGSSGALVAAIFDYCKKAEIKDRKVLQSELARIESFFHGTSSGFDPLLSYLDQPLLRDKESKYRVPEWPIDYEELTKFSLIDSGSKRMVKGLVTYFTEWATEAPQTYQELVTINNSLIDAFLKGAPLSQYMKKLSYFQWCHMQPMILDNMKDAWQHGLESGKYYMKLCGTGGGGYYMFYGRELPAILSEKYGVEPLRI